MRSQAARLQSDDANLEGVDLPPEIFSNKHVFIQTARAGLSGNILRQAVSALGNRTLFINLLETTSGNLGRFYQRSHLDKSHTEGLLDTLRIFSKATAVFGELDKANDWLNTKVTALGDVKPVDLCDTFEGRNLVQDALRKIEYGEFV